MGRVFRCLVHLLPYVFVFISALYIPRDPDLGWHLKYGEYFFHHGQILRENIYSTMMSGYHWANGSWATDILTYAIFHTWDFFGFIIASALIVTGTFFFFAKAAKLTLLEESLFFPLLVYLEFPLNNYSFRGQQISLLLLGILFFILSNYKRSPKILWWVPFLFFLWVNLQTESFLGIAVFGLWVGLIIVQSFLKEKKFFSKEHTFLLKIFFITLFVTFLNPFGWGIHLIAFSHVADPLLKKVTDYVPFLPFTQAWWNQIGALIVLICGIIYFLFKRKLQKNITLFVIPFVLVLLSFTVRRYVWPAYYLFLPLLHVFWQPLEKYTKKYGFFLAYIISLLSITYIFFLKMPFSQFTQISWDTYCELQSVHCSLNSAEYLQKNKLTYNLFTYYDWGGFLIWNYPVVKPSIDGRMHIWQDEKGNRPMAEYDAYMNGQKDINTSSYNSAYLPMDRTIPLYIELDQLIQKGKWKVVYNDGEVGIIVRGKK